MTEITKGTSSIIGSFTNVLRNFIWKISCIGGVGGVLLTGVLYMKQESLLYHPVIGDIPKETSQNPRHYRSPSEYQIPYESHMIRCEDGVTIHSWLLLQRNARECPTIIFFHGNAGNIGLRLPNAHKMFREVKINILMVEYRGFGDSDSVKPTEVGLKLDAEAALNFIRTRSDINPDRIFCFGRSLGGAVAFHLAQYSEKHKDKNGKPLLAGLIVENTFLSISKMVDKLLPFLTPLKFLVLRIGWDSERIAPTISLPLLYLAGDRDELVPFSHMKELFVLSSKSSTFTRMHIIRGGMHNDSWSIGGKEYYAQMHAFVNHVVTNNGDMGRQPNDWSEVEVSVDGTINHDKSSIAIGMGEAEKSRITSIPIMPTNLVSMAKEAAKEASRLSKPQASDKKMK